MPAIHRLTYKQVIAAGSKDSPLKRGDGAVERIRRQRVKCRGYNHRQWTTSAATPIPRTCSHGRAASTQFGSNYTHTPYFRRTRYARSAGVNALATGWESIAALITVELISAFFHLSKAAVPHIPAGGSIVTTSSIQGDAPSPKLMPHAMTKAGLASMTASLAQMLGESGIRVNAVAPGLIWTPLIPSTMPPEKVEAFGTDTPLVRPGQPAEVAPAYVLLASDEASYISGAVIAVTGGKPIL